MSSQLLFSVKEASVIYKEAPVFQDLSLNIHQSKRIALIGKNGAGKSTIMNIISGVKDLDEGEKWEEPGVTIGYLGQEFDFKDTETVFDFIFSSILTTQLDQKVKCRIWALPQAGAGPYPPYTPPVSTG